MASWAPLHLANATDTTPQLLISFDFTATGYTVSVTDLSRLWKEEVDRRQLIRRALNDNTSIDPSEDASQLKILLSKIRSALEGSDGTSVQITADGEDSLFLHIYCSLPPPLDQLRWRAELALQQQESLRNQVTQPLLERLGAMGLQQERLLRYIHDKDHVINKLLDKLESVGTDISDVFPGATASRVQRKTTSRAQAAQQVKGLGKFDEKLWLEQVRSAQESLSNEELMSRIFEPGTVYVKGTQSVGASSSWQKELKEATLSFPDRTLSEPERRRHQSPVVRQVTFSSPQQADQDGEDFQRQATPPSAQKPQQHGKSPRKHSPDAMNVDIKLPAEDSGSETEDEDDLDARPAPKQKKQQDHHERTSNTPQSSEARAKKLGSLGGRRAAEQEDKQEESQPEQTKTKSAIEPETSKLRPTSKLGKIGGRRQSQDTILKPQAQQSVASTGSEHAHDFTANGGWPKSPKGRVGKTPVDAVANDKEAVRVDRVEETQLHVPEAEGNAPESSQDRADRKREELKQQLEAKAQGPVKKKRRF